MTIFLLLSISPLQKSLFKINVILLLKNSKEKKDFIAEFVNSIENINTTNISNKDDLECIVQEYSKISKKSGINIQNTSASLNIPRISRIKSINLNSGNTGLPNY